MPQNYFDAYFRGHLINLGIGLPIYSCYIFFPQRTIATAYIITILLQMLISITECRDGGIWTGRPDLGYWCNTKPAGGNKVAISSKMMIKEYHY